MNSAFAPVTRLIVGVNVAVFFFTSVYLSGKPAIFTEEFLRTYGLVASEFWNSIDWRPWQPVTSLFLHGGLLHLGFNMLGVWSLGIAVERTIGSARFGALYFISGVSGALAVILFQRDLSLPTIGASGALMGLLGAIAVFYPQSELLVFFMPMKARTAAIVFGGLSLVFGFMDDSTGISHWGHLGGLVGGILYSKFALGLSIARNHLSDQPVSRFWAQKMSRRREDEDVTSFLNDFFRRGPGQPPGGPPRNEKVINPAPDERDTFRETPIPPPPPGRKLYFDPVTGRFFFR